MIQKQSQLCAIKDAITDMRLWSLQAQASLRITNACVAKHNQLSRPKSNCRDEIRLVATKLDRSRQNSIGRDKTRSVATKLDRSRQNSICRDRKRSAVTKLDLSLQNTICREKLDLSRQNTICRDKRRLLQLSCSGSRGKYEFLS